jgi:hypothetical protein
VVQELHTLHIFRLDMTSVCGNDNEENGSEAEHDEVDAELE